VSARNPDATKKASLCGLAFVLVPMAGLEPAQLSLLPPQDSVSTNSTTSALILNQLSNKRGI